MKTKRWIFWIMITTLFISSIEVSAQDSNGTEELRRLIIRAETAYQVEDYDGALAEYLKAQQLAPDFPDLYKAIGNVYEKLGTDNALFTAIKNYQEYLRLSPDADDTQPVKDKITALEYIYEKQVKQSRILYDLNGIWISDTKTKGEKPSIIFQMSEIGTTGEYRIEMLPESELYKESIIQKIVKVVPGKNNDIQFTFADAQSYTPQSWTYDLGRILGGGDIISQTAINAMQENDIPKNTQTLYIFNLQSVVLR